MKYIQIIWLKPPAILMQHQLKKINQINQRQGQYGLSVMYGGGPYMLDIESIALGTTIHQLM